MKWAHFVGSDHIFKEVKVKLKEKKVEVGKFTKTTEVWLNERFDLL